ncbi:unnamed protein product, partial [Polarella glacialis]
MGRSIRWKPRWQLKAFVALRKVLSSLPKVMEHAVAILKKSEDPPALLVAAVAAEGTAKAESAYRAPLVELYVKIVLEGKQALPEYSLEAWGPVLAAVTPEEFGKQLLPTALRMSKRQPA